MLKKNHIKWLVALMVSCVSWSSARAAAPSEAQGRVSVRWYDVGGANDISRLTDHAGYPDAPDAEYFPIHFEWPTGLTGLDEDLSLIHI